MSAGSDGLFTPGTRVWVPNAQVGWEAGTILSANDAIISVVVDESGQKVVSCFLAGFDTRHNEFLSAKTLRVRRWCSNG